MATWSVGGAGWLRLQGILNKVYGKFKNMHSILFQDSVPLLCRKCDHAEHVLGM